MSHSGAPSRREDGPFEKTDPAEKADTWRSTRGWRMTDRIALAERFEAQRPRLRAVAYQLLGSGSDAEDVVQDSWLRLEHVDPDTIENLDAWLTTVVSRLALDLLRSAPRRRETAWLVEPWREPASDRGDPEREAAQSDAVELALLVVLDTLTPAERL